MSTPSAPPQQATAFPHQAAKASWASGVMVFLLIALGGRTEAKALIELIALVLMLVGFALGAIAMLGIPKHGTKQLLAPALVGLIINGLLLFIFVNNFLAARAKAQRHTSAWTVSADAVSAGDMKRALASPT